MRRALGAGLVAAGCLLMAWLLLSPSMSGWRAADAQDRLRQQLDRAAADLPVATGRRVPVAAAAAPGEALVEMRLPTLGEDWSWVAVEGTSPEQLATGPGHYPGTPLPGARGNVAFAGHRAGHGDPFLDFDRLAPGDEVQLRQGRAWWTYRLTTSPRIVPATADWVLDPLPGRRLTLTTCWPRYGSSKRMFVRGELVDFGPERDAGRSEVTAGRG